MRPTGAYRRRPAFLAVLLLSIWAQIFAPFGASLAMARSGGDPSGAICSAANDASGPAQAPPAGQVHRQCCALCHFVPAAFAPPFPAASLAPPPARCALADWTPRGERLHGDPALRRAHARAPPVLN